MSRNVSNSKFFLVICLLLGVSNFNYELLAKKKVETVKKEEVEPSPTEDLMREHGILRHLLLIYEEIIKRIDNHKNFNPKILGKSLDLVQSFIEGYHEKLEEKYIFPLFEKKRIEVRLVKALREQHFQGREITDRLKELLNSKKYRTQKTKEQIALFLKKFIYMYRPHAAYEDTVLFVKVRSLMTEKAFKELGEFFEESERRVFGGNGFGSIMKKVEKIKKQLGIGKLQRI